MSKTEIRPHKARLNCEIKLAAWYITLHLQQLCLCGSDKSTVILVFVPLLPPASLCDLCKVHHYVPVIAKALN